MPIQTTSIPEPKPEPTYSPVSPVNDEREQESTPEKESFGEKITSAKMELGREITDPITEAGGTASIDIITPQGAIMNLTSKAISPAAAAVKLIESVAFLRARFGFETSQKGTSSSKNTKQGAATQSDKELHISHIVKMQIIPQPDNKVTVKLFEAGHQYPDLSLNNITAEQAASFGKEAGWVADDFTKPGNFDVSYKATWVNSDKVNQYGKPYKNTVKVENA